MIYRDVLVHSSAGPQLLQTCREIYNEAYAFLFERPLNFRSQSALYRWLQHTPAEHLKRVPEITLELHDADLRPLITSAPEAEADAEGNAVPEPNDPPRLQAWDLYDAELAALRSSLSQLGSLSHLTVRALSETRSFLYREFLANFLTSLSSIWPALRGLTLEGNFHHQSLSFISQLPGLKSISFDGFSSTPPAEMATLLGGLTQLERLALVSQYSLLTPTTYLHSAFSSKRQSFTKDVLLAVKHIASFAVTERMQCSAPALFFTPEMLETLHNHSALKTLTIRLGQKPDADTLEALDAFLGQSGIKRLELDWPGFEAEVLEAHELLPGNLKCAWVRVSSTKVARDLLNAILARRDAGKLAQIRSVVLMRDGQFDVEGGWPTVKELELKKRNDSAVTQHFDLRSIPEVGCAEAVEVGLEHKEVDEETERQIRPEPWNAGSEEPQIVVGTSNEKGTNTAPAPAEASSSNPNLAQRNDAVPKQHIGTVSDEGGVAGDEEENPTVVHRDLANTIDQLKERGVHVLWCTDET